MVPAVSEAPASKSHDGLFGHPKGLVQLFFIEMWERLAFYTMLNILLLYVTDKERGGLGMSAGEGNEIYGLYLAFVYFTPFPGGMIADRFLGYRKAVAVGAVMMATGLAMMSVPGQFWFIGGLVMLILGNGFFKPNISVMVGNLYPAGDPKRDSGFNIFYMGINIGALVAAFLSGFVRNDYGWLWTFRVAAIGLAVGFAILMISWKVLERADRKPEIGADDAGFGDVMIKILLPAVAVGLVGYVIGRVAFPDGFAVRPAVFGFLCGMVPVIIFFVRLGLKASPAERPGLLALLPVFVAGGTFFMVLHLNGSAMTQWARDMTDRTEAAGIPFLPTQQALPGYYVNAGEQVPRPHPDSLLVVEETKYAQMYGQQRLDKAAVADIMKAAPPDIELKRWDPDEADDDSALFQRSAAVYGEDIVTVEEEEDSHGAAIISVKIEEGAKPMERVAFVRDVGNKEIAAFVISDELQTELYDGYEERYGHEPELLEPGEYRQVVNSELFQSFNATFVIVFTPLLVLVWGFFVRRGREVTTARKMFLGLLFTTISLGLMAIAGALTDGGAVKVSGIWLAGFYAIVTIGELCLSPMGLSLVTKLTPRRLVGLAMGGWFMATAFGNNLSGFFGGIQGSLSPVNFFLVLTGLAGLATLVLFALLKRLDAVIKQYGA